MNPMGMRAPKAPPGYKQYQTSNFSPEQAQHFQQMFSHVAPDSFTSRLASGDQSQFEQLEAPAMRQFQQLQGQNASRFSGMGMGARRGSGFQNTMGQDTANFAEQLQSQRLGLQRQAIEDMMHMSHHLLGQKPYEQHLMPKKRKQSFLQKILGIGAPVAGGAIGGFFGGPAGAMAGFNAGNAFGKGFSGQDTSDMDFSGMGNLPNSWESFGYNRGSKDLTGAFGGQYA